MKYALITNSHVSMKKYCYLFRDFADLLHCFQYKDAVENIDLNYLNSQNFDNIRKYLCKFFNNVFSNFDFSLHLIDEDIKSCFYIADSNNHCKFIFSELNDSNKMSKCTMIDCEKLIDRFQKELV